MQCMFTEISLRLSVLHYTQLTCTMCGSVIVHVWHPLGTALYLYNQQLLLLYNTLVKLAGGYILIKRVYSLE